MLDPWIIEEIRKREEEQAWRESEQPVLEVEVDDSRSSAGDARREAEEKRGVVIIDFGG